MSSIKVAVVIPTYRAELNEFEQISLAQCRKVLGKYPLVFVAPEGKIFPYFKSSDIVVHFPQKFFESTKTYNEMMMSPFFYEAFLEFDYILIYQLDAFVFYDALEFFCSLGYDYIGAPVAYSSWYCYRNGRRVPRVGNGGFSLRKVQTCHQLLTECTPFSSWHFFLENYYEDAFFGFIGISDEADFKTAPFFVAVRFAFDFYPERFIRSTGKIPFGCHGWDKFGADFYVEVFKRYGWDLRPLRDKMGNDDYGIRLKSGLENVAINRLVSGIERGQSALQYLPTKRFASIQVFRTRRAIKLLSGMLKEDNSLTDKIFLYDEVNFMKLVNGMPRENLPHFILCTDYDKSLIEHIENRGLKYGEHFISFWHEYMTYQEKLFHNLGK
mgnify:CR=1 FL=1